MPKLILYSKPGCHLCESLQERLEQLTHPPFELEIRDIHQNPEWFQKYQYEIPVLCRLVQVDELLIEQPLPRLSPRASLPQLAQMLQKYIGIFKAE